MLHNDKRACCYRDLFLLVGIFKEVKFFNGGVRKAYFFCQNCKGKGLDHRAVPPL